MRFRASARRKLSKWRATKGLRSVTLACSNALSMDLSLAFGPWTKDGGVRKRVVCDCATQGFLFIVAMCFSAKLYLAMSSLA